MTQSTLFNLGPTPPRGAAVDPLDGFDAWWKLYPKNPKHGGGRKYGKGKCEHYWKHYKLWKQKDKIMAALREDIRGIEKGHFAFSPGSNDRMYKFPAAPTWLNPNAVKGARWDRDVEPEKPKPVRVVQPEIVVKPLTPEDVARGRRLMEQAAAKARSQKRADVMNPDGTVAARGRAAVTNSNGS